jgi:hypothetical protein
MDALRLARRMAHAPVTLDRSAPAAADFFRDVHRLVEPLRFEVHYLLTSDDVVVFELRRAPIEVCPRRARFRGRSRSRFRSAPGAHPNQRWQTFPKFEASS